MKAVAAKTVVWKDTVTLGTPDAPTKTCALYASDAVLWGTVSEEVRETPEQIYDYFVSWYTIVEVKALFLGDGSAGKSGNFAALFAEVDSCSVCDRWCLDNVGLASNLTLR